MKFCFFFVKYSSCYSLLFVLTRVYVFIYFSLFWTPNNTNRFYRFRFGRMSQNFQPNFLGLLFVQRFNLLSSSKISFQYVFSESKLFRYSRYVLQYCVIHRKIYRFRSIDVTLIHASVEHKWTEIRWYFSGAIGMKLECFWFRKRWRCTINYIQKYKHGTHTNRKKTKMCMCWCAIVVSLHCLITFHFEVRLLLFLTYSKEQSVEWLSIVYLKEYWKDQMETGLKNSRANSQWENHRISIDWMLWSSLTSFVIMFFKCASTVLEDHNS